jgi:hypothetical protein
MIQDHLLLINEKKESSSAFGKPFWFDYLFVGVPVQVPDPGSLFPWLLNLHRGFITRTADGLNGRPKKSLLPYTEQTGSVCNRKRANNLKVGRLNTLNNTYFLVL